MEAVTPAILARSHLRLEFRNQLTLFVNGSAAEHWPLAWQGHRYVLPPFGWAAFAPDFIQLGAEREGGRFDYLATPSLRYFDGRGDPEPFRGFESADPVLLRRIGSGSWEAIVFGSGGDVTIPPPDLLPADAWDVEARDRTDQPLERWSLPVTGDALRLPGHEGVWRYVLTPQAPAQPDHP